MPSSDPEPSWPAQEQAFASEIRLLQQRIDALDLTAERHAGLARQLRRAIATARCDVQRGRRELARLSARIDVEAVPRGT